MADSYDVIESLRFLLDQARDARKDGGHPGRLAGCEIGPGGVDSLQVSLEDGVRFDITVQKAVDGRFDDELRSIEQHIKEIVHEIARVRSNGTWTMSITLLNGLAEHVRESREKLSQVRRPGT